MCCTDLHHLLVEVNLAVKRLRKKPSVSSRSLLALDWTSKKLSYQCITL
ncbi:MAG: hypothetical protein QOH63_3627 [Acidobacteriota bacterium]|jgi:hypothetical protein|nr:hypothetical protein [Acidobacteriota bacterium]